MGSADVCAYSRNKRGIAGSLIWVNFDRHALLNLFSMAGATFLADNDEIRPRYQGDSSVGQTSRPTEAWYSDQVLPFDVTLAGTVVVLPHNVR